MNIKEIILTERVLHPYTPAGKEAIRMMEPVVQTTADAARAGANELTYGHYDKGAAAANATIKGTDYDTELKKQYAKSAEAEKRSPTASEVGRIASYAVPVGSAALGAKLAVKGASKILPKTLNTATKTGKAISIGSKGGAGIGGGVAGDVAAKEIATQFDPNNPHLEEGLGSKILGFLQKDVRGSAASGSKASKLSTAAGQPPTPAPVATRTSTILGPDGRPLTVPSSSKAPAPAPATATTPKAPAPATATTPSTASVVGKKIGQWAKDAAVGTAKSLARTAAVGTGLYYAAPYAWDYATKPPEAYGEKGFQQEKARQAEIERERKAMNATDTSTTMQPTADTPTQPTVDTTSPEQQPSNDDGPLSTPGTFKTNEDSKELARVKHLARYRN